MVRNHTLNLLSLLMLSALTTPATAAPPAYKKPVVVGTYRQQVRKNYTTAEGLPDNKINCLAGYKQLFAGTQSGIARYNGTSWEVVHNTSSPVTAMTVKAKQVWFAKGKQINVMSSEGMIQNIGTLRTKHNVTNLEVTPGGLLVGTSAGVWILSNGNLINLKVVSDLLNENSEVRQFSTSTRHQTAIATNGGLILYNWDDNSATRIHAENDQGGWFLKDVRGVGYDQKQQLWFATPQGIGYETGTEWTLLSPAEGLPYNDFTGLSVGPDGDVWLGTKIGAVHFFDGTWEYRQGKRWLITDQIDDLVVTQTGDVWFATQQGISRIEPRLMTLREKANFFDTEIDKYNRRTEFGFVNTVSLAGPGDKSKVTPHDNDNDGLWTSMYGAAQCFAYAVTRNPESKKRANKAMKALGFLSEVTQGGTNPAPYGFPARTILPTSGHNPNDQDNPDHDRRRRDIGDPHKGGDPLWKVLIPRWPVSEDGRWYWKTDTSSDELDGHFFFYGLYYDLVAETEEEKAYVRQVVDRIATHLVDHDYDLVDHDGKPTRWGRFSPKVLNKDLISDIRGLNSVSILSFLLVAEHVTGDPKYRKAYETLLDQHDYYTNVLIPKWQTGSGTGNQSDDEMAFMCYYSLLSYEEDPRLRTQYQRSLVRYFQQEVPEMCPLFNFIFAKFYEPPRWYWKNIQSEFINIIPEAVETLKRYPLDRVNWRMTNSHRLDIVPMPANTIRHQGRGYRNNGKVLPMDELFIERWNHDPWRLDQGGNGNELADGASFLLPYYMGLHHGFIVEPNRPANQVSSSRTGH